MLCALYILLHEKEFVYVLNIHAENFLLPRKVFESLPSNSRVRNRILNEYKISNSLANALAV